MESMELGEWSLLLMIAGTAAVGLMLIAVRAAYEVGTDEGFTEGYFVGKKDGKKEGFSEGQQAKRLESLNAAVRGNQTYGIGGTFAKGNNE